MLILFNPSKRGISIGVFITPQFLHSQKLCTCLGQKYHLEWYFLMRPTQTIFVLPPNHFDKVAVTFFHNVIVLSPCCTEISLLKWLTPCLTM